MESIGTNELLNFLINIELFNKVQLEDIEYFSKLSSIFYFKKGEKVLSVRAEINHVYIVMKGEIEVSLITFENNEREILPNVSEGGILGEMEAFDKKNIIADCIAKTDVTLIGIKMDDFISFLEKSHVFRDKIIKSTISKWRNIETRYHYNIEKLEQAIEKIKIDEELLHNQQTKILEESKLKEIFIENISHELRTPLTIIHGVLESLDIENNGKILLDSEMYNKLQSSSNYLLDLINELLDFSQLSKRELALIPSWIDPSTELKTILDNFTFIPSGKQLNKDIKVSYSLPSPILIYVDLKRIRQILYHLVSNAIKFTEKGTVDIRIFCHSFNIDSCTFCIIVKDSGIGISEKNLSIIFKDFARIKNKFYGLRGTGLGLAFVKNLVELMAGQITIDSYPSMGSEFSVYIPVSFKQLDKTKILKEKKNTAIDYKKHKKLLLIDDYEDTHVIVNALLKNLPIKVDSLYDSLNVLSMVKEHNYDIILLDIMLPETNGYEIHSMLKEYYASSEGKKHTLPKIIAFTALRSETELKKIENSGFSGKIHKPFRKKDLIDVIYEN